MSPHDKNLGNRVTNGKYAVRLEVDPECPVPPVSTRGLGYSSYGEHRAETKDATKQLSAAELGMSFYGFV